MKISVLTANGAFEYALLEAERFLDNHPGLRDLEMQIGQDVSGGLYPLKVRPLERVPVEMAETFQKYEDALNAIYSYHIRQGRYRHPNALPHRVSEEAVPWYISASLIAMLDGDDSIDGLELLAHPRQNTHLLRVISSSPATRVIGHIPGGSDSRGINRAKYT